MRLPRLGGSSDNVESTVYCHRTSPDPNQGTAAALGTKLFMDALHGMVSLITASQVPSTCLIVLPRMKSECQAQVPLVDVTRHPFSVFAVAIIVMTCYRAHFEEYAFCTPALIAADNKSNSKCPHHIALQHNATGNEAEK